MIDAEQLKRTLSVICAWNFRRSSTRTSSAKPFTKKWKKRADPNAKGSLLVVTGTLRRSIKAEERPNGVRFSSAVPYAQIHNEGGKGTKSVRAHTRRSKNGKTYTVKAHMRKFTMPQRQFVGDGKRTQEIIKGVINDNLADFNMQLSKFIKQ